MGGDAPRPVAIDLSARTKLRVSGSDSLRYLNGQLTNDVRKATATSARYAVVLDAKGHIDADVFIRREGESFLIDADPALREQLISRLERYIIADDVQLDDVTEEFALFHVIGGGAAGVAAWRFGCDGIDVWTTSGARDDNRASLSASAELITDDEMETFRIERGVPRWGHELTKEIIPPEAGLDARAIDYAKGCYIGQEVISRMKMSGQTNKRLCGLVSTGGGELCAGWRLFSGSESRDCGWLTSATYSKALGKQIALAFVRRGHHNAGTNLAAGETRVPVAVANLPFL